MSNIDHLTKVQYSAGKPRILTFIWKPKKAACLLGVLYLLKAQNPCGSFLLYMPEATNECSIFCLNSPRPANQFSAPQAEITVQRIWRYSSHLILSKLPWKEKRALEEYLKGQNFIVADREKRAKAMLLSRHATHSVPIKAHTPLRSSYVYTELSHM